MREKKKAEESDAVFYFSFSSFLSPPEYYMVDSCNYWFSSHPFITAVYSLETKKEGHLNGINAAIIYYIFIDKYLPFSFTLKIIALKK